MKSKTKSTTTNVLWSRKSRFMDTEEISFYFPAIVEIKSRDELGHLEQLKRRFFGYIADVTRCCVCLSIKFMTLIAPPLSPSRSVCFSTSSSHSSQKFVKKMLKENYIDLSHR